jgi:hypothetical protein
MKSKAKKTLKLAGAVIFIAALVNMAFQWFLESDKLIPEDDFSHREAASAIFLLLGGYLYLTFRRRKSGF